MKLALISDIHEDIVSLTRALKKIEKTGCDKIVCLGDISGFSVPYYHYLRTRNASKCLSLVLSNCEIIVAGNHDLYACKKLPEISDGFVFPENWYQLDYHKKMELSEGKIWLFQNNELDPLYKSTDIEALNQLKEFAILQDAESKMLFSHYAYPNLSGYSKGFYSGKEELSPHFDFMQKHNCAVSFFGHIHPSGIMVCDDKGIEYHRFNKRVKLKKTSMVGLPSIASSNNKSGFCIFDTSTLTTKAVRI